MYRQYIFVLNLIVRSMFRMPYKKRNLSLQEKRMTSYAQSYLCVSTFALQVQNQIKTSDIIR